MNIIDNQTMYSTNVSSFNNQFNLNTSDNDMMTATATPTSMFRTVTLGEESMFPAMHSTNMVQNQNNVMNLANPLMNVGMMHAQSTGMTTPNMIQNTNTMMNVGNSLPIMNVPTQMMNGGVVQTNNMGNAQMMNMGLVQNDNNRGIERTPMMPVINNNHTPMLNVATDMMTVGTMQTESRVISPFSHSASMEELEEREQLVPAEWDDRFSAPQQQQQGQIVTLPHDFQSKPVTHMEIPYDDFSLSSHEANSLTEADDLESFSENPASFWESGVLIPQQNAPRVVPQQNAPRFGKNLRFLTAMAV